MSTPGLIMWATVLLIGVPSSWRNPTAGALVLCWIISKAIYLLTGSALAVDYYIFPDIAVLAIIFAKPAACNYEPYQNTWVQLKCIVLERSVPDRIVMLMFPLEWTIYVSRLHPYYTWYALWGLSLVQFLAAGWEGFSKMYRARAVSETPDYPSGDVFRLVWGGGGG